MSQAAGRKVQVIARENLGEERRRNLILRATVTGEGGTDRAIIIKATRAGSYDASAVDVFEAQGFAREWTALRLLDGAGRAPCLLAADIAAGVLVIDDAGVLPSLVTPLLEGGATEAEAALTGYAAALAELHVATLGCRTAHAAVLRDGFSQASLPTGARWVDAVMRPVFSLLEQHPIEPSRFGRIKLLCLLSSRALLPSQVARKVL